MIIFSTLRFATVDDTSDADGEGTITVTLKLNERDVGKYTISTASGANTATVTVIEVPTPVLTIVSLTPSTNEGEPATIIVRASEDPKRPLTFNYTPTEVGTNYLASFLRQDDTQ